MVIVYVVYSYEFKKYNDIYRFIDIYICICFLLNIVKMLNVFIIIYEKNLSKSLLVFKEY